MFFLSLQIFLILSFPFTENHLSYSALCQYLHVIKNEQCFCTYLIIRVLTIDKPSRWHNFVLNIYLFPLRGNVISVELLKNGMVIDFLVRL
jgi:hypothetical protein